MSIYNSTNKKIRFKVEELRVVRPNQPIDKKQKFYQKVYYFISEDYIALPIRAIAPSVDEGIQLVYFLLCDYNKRLNFPPQSISELDFTFIEPNTEHHGENKDSTDK